MSATPLKTPEAKHEHTARVDAELERLHRPSSRSEREKLALTALILAAEGHVGGLAGQLTARVGPERFLTLPLGIGFDEADATDMIVVDGDLKVVEGHGVPNPATRFHLWIYRHKPSIHAIVHTHAPATSALSMIGQPLVIAHMDMCMFQDQCAYLSDWPGLPIGDEEGMVISSALGDCKTILLANHGSITTGKTIEEAAYLAFFFERAAELQLIASSSGTIRTVDPKKAREARDFLLKPQIVETTFDYLARKVERGIEKAHGSSVRP